MGTWFVDDYSFWIIQTTSTTETKQKRTNSEYKTLQLGNLSWFRVCDRDQSPFRMVDEMKAEDEGEKEKKTNQAIHSTKNLFR